MVRENPQYLAKAIENCLLRKNKHTYQLTFKHLLNGLGKNKLDHFLLLPIFSWFHNMKRRNLAITSIIITNTGILTVILFVHSGVHI